MTNSQNKRCCMKNGCFDCNKNSEYVRTVPLLTPYYHPIIDIKDATNGVDAPEKNYVPYNLFTFRTKFERMLYHHNPRYHFSFVSKELDGVMRLTVELYDGDKFVPLDEEEASIIQNFVDKSVSEYPAHCLVFDSSVPIIRGTKTLTCAWVSSIVEFLQFDEKFHSIIREGKVYLSFMDDVQYIERYGLMYEQIVDVLFDFFKRGVVPLSARFHADIIESFKMKVVHEQLLNPVGGLRLHEATWRNPYFAEDMVQFIYNRVQKNNDIQIHVGDNFVRRHYVSVALNEISQRKFGDTYNLKNYIPKFSGKYVIVPAKNVDDAFAITDAIISSQSQSSGKVELVPLKNPEHYDNTVERLLNKYKTLIPGEDIVMYQIVDVPEYVASFLLPTPMTTDQLKILQR